MRYPKTLLARSIASGIDQADPLFDLIEAFFNAIDTTIYAGKPLSDMGHANLEIVHIISNASKTLIDAPQND